MAHILSQKRVVKPNRRYLDSPSPAKTKPRRAAAPPAEPDFSTLYLQSAGPSQSANKSLDSSASRQSANKSLDTSASRQSANKLLDSSSSKQSANKQLGSSTSKQSANKSLDSSSSRQSANKLPDPSTSRQSANKLPDPSTSRQSANKLPDPSTSRQSASGESSRPRQHADFSLPIYSRRKTFVLDDEDSEEADDVPEQPSRRQLQLTYQDLPATELPAVSPCQSTPSKTSDLESEEPHEWDVSVVPPPAPASRRKRFRTDEEEEEEAGPSTKRHRSTSPPWADITPFCAKKLSWMVLATFSAVKELRRSFKGQSMFDGTALPVMGGASIDKSPFPIEKMAVLRSVEARLKTDPQFRSKLVYDLTLCGTAEPKKMVFKCLRFMMIPFIGRKHTFLGKESEGKLPFKDYLMYAAMTDAMRQYYKTRNGPGFHLEDEIIQKRTGRWLTTAKDPKKVQKDLLLSTDPKEVLSTPSSSI